MTGIKPHLGKNITLNGKQYPIAENVFTQRKGPAFWVEESSSDQFGLSGQKVWARWDRGGQGGMGEVRRFSEDSPGYAFSEGWDCTSFGLFRLRPTIKSVTPAAAPVDAKTFLFQASPAPQAIFNVMAQAKSVAAAPVAQNFAHGLGVIPKWMMFSTSGKTNETVSAGLIMSVGFSDGTDDGCIGIASTDASGTAAQATRRFSGVITIVNGANTVVAEGTVTAVDTTNVEVTWSTNDATATIIHMAAGGGSDVSAKVKEWSTGTSTGVVSTTGIGFQPDVVLHLAHDLSVNTGVAFDATATDGHADGDAGTTTTFSLTTSGSNRFLFTRIFLKSASDTVSGVTYGGVAMTRQERKVYTTGGITSYLYRLVAPASGANNIVVTFTTGNQQARITGASFTGVNQSDPYRAQSSTNAQSATYSKVYTSQEGELVLSFIDAYAAVDGGMSHSATPGAGQTERYDNNGSWADSGARPESEMSTEAGATSVTMSGTLNGFDPPDSDTPYTIHTVVALKPIVATDTVDNMRFAMGWMENNGNQGTVGIAGEETGTSNTARQQSTAHCLRGINPSGTVTYALTRASHDEDGFSVNVGTAPASSVTVTSICLKGVRAYAGNFQKPTSATTSAVTGVGFTPEFVMFMQDMTSTTETSNTAAHARMGVSWMDDGGTEGAIAVSDTDALDTTSTDGVSKTSKVNVSLDNDTQTVDDEADWTSMNADGFTTTYSTADATASKVLYLALSQYASSTDKFVYMLNATRAYKLKVETDNSITVQNTRDFGGATSLGRPARFESVVEIPFGADADFRALTTVMADTSNDTYTVASGSGRALAFATIQDGATAKVLRGHTVNNVDLAATTPTTITNFGGDFEVGDSSAAITNAADSGVAAYVAKTDGLYRFTPEGVAQQLITSEPDDDNGSGLTVISQTKIAFYNDLAGLHVVMGDTIALNVGPDGLPYNEAIPGISYEPYRGRHYEMAVAGKWIYSLYRVTESGVSRTFIMAGYMVDLPRGIIWHTLAQLSGPARGLGFFQSRLWWHVNGSIQYLKLSASGAPDAGRDSIGRGDVSSTFRNFLPETDFGYPHTPKQLDRLEIVARGIDDTSPIQLQVARDGGALENVGTAITATEVSKRYWTAGVSDSCEKVRIVPTITTTSGYAPSTSDPQILSVIAEATLNPDVSATYHFYVDTGQTLYNGGSVDDARAMYTDLKALESAASVVLSEGPLGLASTQVNIRSVTAPQILQANGDEFHLVIEVVAQERTTA